MGDMHVVHDKQSGKYYMYFIDRNFKNYAMFRALSANETGFDFENAELVTIENEEAGYRCPHVFIEGGKWFIYYCYKDKDRAGYATSDDGLNWKTQNPKVFDGHDPEILKMEDKLYLLFYCPPDYKIGHLPGCDIRVAVFKGDLDELNVLGK